MLYEQETISGLSKKLSQFGEGLTIIRSDQGPYIEDAVKILSEAAAELGIKSQVVELHNCQEVQNLVPSAFGVFSIVYAGNLISYHYLTKNEFLKRLDKLRK